ncbi:MAG: M56 family metallopeptidase [Bacteroidetes bacterium]|nr:M56 family metallopeptidase [Bacteroidota bacterium]
MIHYILQTIVFQLLFLVVYDLFLKKETFFNINRFYLLITSVLSLLLPLVQIAAIRNSIPQEFMIELPDVIIGTATSETGTTLVGSFLGVELSWQNLWLLGGILSLSVFSLKLFKLFKLKRTGSVARFHKFSIVKLPGTSAAFTFFRNIFLGEDLSEVQQERIIIHEKVHVTQKHSWDLLFYEILKIFFWFNPLVYIFQKRMAVLQEYIADRHATTQRTHREYYQELLSQVFQTQKISFINTFFNRSLIKNRIIMLQKSKSKKIAQLKYLLLIPIIAGMLVYSSCSEEAELQKYDNSANFKINTEGEILHKISELKEAIAENGTMTKEQEQILQKLLVLNQEDGVDNLHFGDESYFKAGVPFGQIDKIPTFPGCEGMKDEDAKKCFSNKVSGLVARRFNTKIAKDLGLFGKQIIKVQFKIDNTGNIVNVRSKAPHPDLEKEAIRVVNTLPQMIPGEHKGKKVSVNYSLPIHFIIDE